MSLNQVRIQENVTMDKIERIRPLRGFVIVRGTCGLRYNISKSEWNKFKRAVNKAFRAMDVELADK